jgi:seryl-tRNA synthetase
MGGRATGQEMGLEWMTLLTTTRTKDGGTGKMNIYKELEEIDTLRQRIKDNQNQVLDIYDSKDERMDDLLAEMNELLIEVDQVENEMWELQNSL